MATDVHDYHRVTPEEARTLWEAHFWDDATMAEWMHVRGGSTLQQAAEMMAFMRAQRRAH